uniref:Putative LOV domain-containing protein n=1 Tax=Lunularia cruciata TaxID=56931 RepID=A0A126X251_9MARC|nr:putative LOV domain-containing protein [Lunularia cruciata]
MPQLKNPPVGSGNKAYNVHQPNIFSREVELSRNTRGSLEIFGGGPHTSPLLFSRTRSAWKNALQSAESHLQGSGDVCQDEDPHTGRVLVSISEIPSSSLEQVVRSPCIEGSDAQSSAGLLPINDTEDDVAKWLTDAENAGDLPNTSKLLGSRTPTTGSVFPDTDDKDPKVPRLGLMESVVAPNKAGTDQEWKEVLQLSREKKTSGHSEMSDDSLSDRAAQWGYSVVLKPSSDRGSGYAETERLSTSSSITRISDSSSDVGKSSRATSEGSYAGSNISSTIPGVSRAVRDALGSFQLAFVVCDALNPEYPILYASAGFFSMTGYAAKEVVGRNCRLLQGEYTDAKDVAKIREALKAGCIYTGKLLNYKRDGTPFWNLLTISPIKDDTGRLIKYIGMQAEVKESCAVDSTTDETIVSEAMKILSKEGRSSERNPKLQVGTSSTTYSSQLKICEKSESRRISRSRYSLSSPRDSSEGVSKFISTSELPVGAILNGEVAPLRAAAVGNKPFEVPDAMPGESGCLTTKASKRSSSLINMFKKLNGRFSISKRRSQDRGDVVSDPDDELFDDLEDKQRRSSLYSNTSSADEKQELGRTLEVSAGHQSNTWCFEELRESSSPSGDLSRIHYHGESSTRMERCSDSYSIGGPMEKEKEKKDNRRPPVRHGRRSAQYATCDERANLRIGSLALEDKDRRHSIATVSSSVKFEGKSQFCIVHSTATE